MQPNNHADQIPTLFPRVPRQDVAATEWEHWATAYEILVQLFT